MSVYSVYTDVVKVLKGRDNPEAKELVEILELQMQLNPEETLRWLNAPNEELSWRQPGNQILVPEEPNTYPVLQIAKQTFPPVEELKRLIADKLSSIQKDTNPEPSPVELLVTLQERAQDVHPVNLRQLRMFPILPIRLSRKESSRRRIR